MTFRYLILFLMFLSIPMPEVAQVLEPSQTKSLLQKLDSAIEHKQDFQAKKYQQIKQLQYELKATSLPLTTQFLKYNKLYAEYKTYQYDSAFLYARTLQKIAYQLKDPVHINYAKLQLSFTLLSSGMYKECIDSLNTITMKAMPDSIKVAYYVLLSRSYYELAAYNSDAFYLSQYNAKGNYYSDLALEWMDEKNLQYYFVKGIKELKERNFEMAKKDFHIILKQFHPDSREYAMVSSALASAYMETGHKQIATDLMIEAAIADMKSCTKEGLALVYVADLLYHEQHDEDAYRYIKEALTDASFYGARLRLKHVSSILPMIEGNRLSTVEEQNNRLLMFTVVVSILSLLVLFFAYIIFKQLRKLKKAEKEIILANTQLQETNAVLQTKNNELQEANKIKEEYIGYSFNMYAQYLDKIEKLKKNLEKKISAKSIEGVGQVLDSINMKKEREILYLSFDKIFIQLFPNFIPAFNALFKEEDRYRLKEGQPLNLDLRIFALIRIGISDHEQIANILEYSVRTIYNHKTQVKTKSLIANDLFESKIMEIRAF